MRSGENKLKNGFLSLERKLPQPEKPDSGQTTESAMSKMSGKNIDDMNRAADRKPARGSVASRAKTVTGQLKKRPSTSGNVTRPSNPKRGNAVGPRRGDSGVPGKARTGGRVASATARGDGSVGDRNSSASAQKRAEATKSRLKRNRSAQNSAVKKTAAKSAARSAAVKGAASAVAKRAGVAGALYSGAKALVDLNRKTSKQTGKSVRQIRKGVR